MADQKGLPKILKLEEKFPCFKAASKMGAAVGDDCVLVNPSDVEAIMKAVPKGKLISVLGICKKLAEQYGVPACCTLTAGIFISTAANAAEEERREGRKNSTPYWRTVKADGFLNDKYPGGGEGHKKLLEEEGYGIIRRGKRYQVENFGKHSTD